MIIAEKERSTASEGRSWEPVVSSGNFKQGTIRQGLFVIDGLCCVKRFCFDDKSLLVKQITWIPTCNCSCWTAEYLSQNFAENQVAYQASNMAVWCHKQFPGSVSVLELNVPDICTNKSIMR